MVPIRTLTLGFFLLARVGVLFTGPRPCRNAVQLFCGRRQSLCARKGLAWTRPVRDRMDEDRTEQLDRRYYLGNNYATGLQQSDAAIPAFQQVVLNSTLGMAPGKPWQFNS